MNSLPPSANKTPFPRTGLHERPTPTYALSDDEDSVLLVDDDRFEDRFEDTDGLNQTENLVDGLGLSGPDLSGTGDGDGIAGQNGTTVSTTGNHGNQNGSSAPEENEIRPPRREAPSVTDAFPAGGNMSNISNHVFPAGRFGLSQSEGPSASSPLESSPSGHENSNSYSFKAQGVSGVIANLLKEEDSENEAEQDDGDDGDENDGENDAEDEDNLQSGEDDGQGDNECPRFSPSPTRHGKKRNREEEEDRVKPSVSSVVPETGTDDIADNSEQAENTAPPASSSPSTIDSCHLLNNLIQKILQQKADIEKENYQLKQKVRSLEQKLELTEEGHGRRLKHQTEEYEFQLATLRQRCERQAGELGLLETKCKRQNIDLQTVRSQLQSQARAAALSQAKASQNVSGVNGVFFDDELSGLQEKHGSQEQHGLNVKSNKGKGSSPGADSAGAAGAAEKQNDFHHSPTENADAISSAINYASPMELERIGKNFQDSKNTSKNTSALDSAFDDSTDLLAPHANPLEFYFQQHKKRLQQQKPQKREDSKETNEQEARNEEIVRQQFRAMCEEQNATLSGVREVREVPREVVVSSPPERKGLVGAGGNKDQKTKKKNDFYDVVEHVGSKSDFSDASLVNLVDVSDLSAGGAGGGWMHGQQHQNNSFQPPSRKNGVEMRNVGFSSSPEDAQDTSNLALATSVDQTQSNDPLTTGTTGATSNVAGKKRIHMTIPRSVISPSTPNPDATLSHPVVWRVEHFKKKVNEHPPGSCLYSPSFLFAGVLRFDFALYPRGGGRRMSVGSAASANGGTSGRRMRTGSKDSCGSTGNLSSLTNNGGLSARRKRANSDEMDSASKSTRKLSRDSSASKVSGTKTTPMQRNRSVPAGGISGSGRYGNNPKHSPPEKNTRKKSSPTGRKKSSPTSTSFSAADLINFDGNSSAKRTKSPSPLTSIAATPNSERRRTGSSGSTIGGASCSSSSTSAPKPLLVARCTCIGAHSPVLKELSFIPFLASVKGVSHPFRAAREVSFQTAITDTLLGADGALVCGLEIVRMVKGGLGLGKGGGTGGGAASSPSVGAGAGGGTDGQGRK